MGSNDYCGDPNNIFVFGHSTGAAPVAKLGTESRWQSEQQHIRAMMFAGFTIPVVPSLTQSPSLLVTGTEGGEVSTTVSSAVFSAASSGIGADSDHVIVPGRDHFTLVAELARAGDPGRVAILQFMQAQLSRSGGGCLGFPTTQDEPSSDAAPVEDGPANGERLLAETR